jgi:hypothetical protein
MKISKIVRNVVIASWLASAAGLGWYFQDKGSVESKTGYVKYERLDGVIDILGDAWYALKYQVNKNDGLFSSSTSIKYPEPHEAKAKLIEAEMKLTELGYANEELSEIINSMPNINNIKSWDEKDLVFYGMKQQQVGLIMDQVDLDERVLDLNENLGIEHRKNILGISFLVPLVMSWAYGSYKLFSHKPREQ